MYRIFRVARAAGLGVLVAAGCAPDVPVRPSGAVSFDAAAASRPPFVFPAGCCYYQGRIGPTVVPPPTDPQAGIDNFSGSPPAATAGQKAGGGVAPGAPGYTVGPWNS